MPSAAPTIPDARRQERSALIAAVAAFLTWGIVPAFWKLLRTVSAPEILAHRFVWTTVFLVALLTWQRRWPEVRASLRSRRAMIYCLSSGLAISNNWLLFIWAVNVGRVIETSLGYFMTPLINVLFGAIFLRERLMRIQLLAVLLATSGVLYLTFGYGKFPWVAIALGMSFGIYGLLRKQSGTRPIPGLFLETTLLTPLACAYLLFLQHRHALAFASTDWSIPLLLVASGVVTSLPLVWFGHAARNLPLSTLGFLQYLAPTGSFMLGVFLYHEPFTHGHLITFSLIWIALAIFTGEALLRWRSNHASAREAAELTPAASYETVT